MVGGSGFIISSTLIMIEVQERWYAPNLKSLGWHIGFWNLVGAIGFTLCGALGFGIGRAGAGAGLEYASTLATFIGSWAFLVSRRRRRAGPPAPKPPPRVPVMDALMTWAACLDRKRDTVV